MNRSRLYQLVCWVAILVLAASGVDAQVSNSQYSGNVIFVTGLISSVQDQNGSGAKLTLNGQNSCAVAITGNASGFSATVVGTNDFRSWSAVPTINSGSAITSNGTFSGIVAPATLGGIGISVTAIASGTINYTLTCSTAAGASSGGGGGGSGGTYTAPPVQPVAPATGASPFPISAPSPIGVIPVAGASPFAYNEPALASSSFTLTAACSTPLTPLSCPAGSFKIFDLSSGGDEWSFQLNTPNGITIAPESSNDGTNFFASAVTVPGSTPLVTSNSITTAGKFTGLAAGSHYVALVATVSPTAAVTVYPYLSAHSTGVSIHSAAGLFTSPTSGNVPCAIATTALTLCSAPTKIFVGLVNVAGAWQPIALTCYDGTTTSGTQFLATTVANPIGANQVVMWPGAGRVLTGTQYACQSSVTPSGAGIEMEGR